MYLRVVAEQQAGNVTLSIEAPDGALLKMADASDKPWIPEVLSLVTVTAGEYSLAVSARGAGPASYRLTIEEIRAAVAEDSERVGAEEAFQEGRRLAADSSVESRRSSLAVFQRAADGWQAIGDRAGLGRALHEMGYVQFDLGDRQEALASYEEALSARKEAGDLAGVVKTLNTLAECLEEIGRSDDAQRRGRAALELSLRLGDLRLQALTLNNLGFLEFRRGRYADAADHLERALSLRRDTGDLRGASTTLLNLAACHRNLGQATEALEHSLEALELARQQSDIGTEATVLQNLGVLYKARGDIQAALDVYNRARDLAAAIGRRATEAWAASNLGELYLLLGESDRALELFRQALSSNRAIASVDGEARDLMKIGELHLAAGRRELARASFEEAIVKSRFAQDLKNEAYSLRGLARESLDAGDPLRARKLLNDALSLQRRIGFRPGQVETLRDLGHAYVELGEHDEALVSYQESIAAAAEIGDRYGEARSRVGLGRLERLRGNLNAARAQLEAGLAIIESLRTQVLSPDLRASFLARSQDDFVTLADVMIEQSEVDRDGGNQRAAFEVSERARARSLVELLTEAQIEVRQGIDRSLAESEKELDARLWLAQSNLIRELSSTEPDAAKVAMQRRRLEDIRFQREELRWRIRREHPRYAEIRYPQPLGLTAVQALLAPDSALLEYLLGPARSLLFVVTTDGLAVYELPARSELVDLIREARQGLESPDRRRFGSFLRSASRLYQELIAPARDRLEGKSHLIVAPDAELYYLPFEALVATSPAAPPTYLIERWALSYAPSGSVLASLDREAAETPDKTLLAFGDPVLPRNSGAAREEEKPPTRGLAERPQWRWRRLEGARREVIAIAELYGSDRAAVFLGPDASEHNFETSVYLDSARVVHLAAHAIVDERRPAYSALLMSHEPGDEEDGLLEAHEIFNLNLGADLVVLSACETALGKDVRGEGLVGLTRAFLYAGARSVTVSLWPVDDVSTADLMVHFHRQLREGADKAQALRSAKLTTLSSGRWRHPYYWAPFVLMGASDRL